MNYLKTDPSPRAYNAPRVQRTKNRMLNYEVTNLDKKDKTKYNKKHN